MTVEDDTVRGALLVDFGQTIVHAGGNFTAVAGEHDGLQLDGGVTTDGGFELLAVTTDLAAVSEHDAITIAGAAFTVAKLDHIGEGFSVIHADPA